MPRATETETPRGLGLVESSGNLLIEIGVRQRCSRRVQLATRRKPRALSTSAPGESSAHVCGKISGAVRPEGGLTSVERVVALRELAEKRVNGRGAEEREEKKIKGQFTRLAERRSDSPRRESFVGEGNVELEFSAGEMRSPRENRFAKCSAVERTALTLQPATLARPGVA